MDRTNHVLDGGPEVLRYIAMATNFETKIAINWLYVNDSDEAIGYGGGLSGRPTECRYCQYPAPKGRCHVAMATTFWLSMDYNFGRVIARNTLFASRGAFLGSSYPTKI